MQLLEQGGILVTARVSYHIDQDLFREMLIDAAYGAGRRVRILEMRTQARDHPILLTARETEYLKCQFWSWIKRKNSWTRNEKKF